MPPSFAALHPQVFGKRHAARAPHLLQRDVQHQRRALAQDFGRGPRPVRVVGFERADDLGHGAEAEESVDLRASRGQARFARDGR